MVLRYGVPTVEEKQSALLLRKGVDHKEHIASASLISMLPKIALPNLPSWHSYGVVEEHSRTISLKHRC